MIARIIYPRPTCCNSPTISSSLDPIILLVVVTQRCEWDQSLSILQRLWPRNSASGNTDGIYLVPSRKGGE